MAQNASDIRIAITGRVLTAPLGSTPPVEIADVWPVAWVDHGLTDPNGVKFGPKVTRYDVKAWQSDTAVRSRITERALEYQLVLLQSGGLNTQLYFGGGSWAAVPAHSGVSQYTPPIPGVDDIRMGGLEFKDGTIIKRFVFPSVTVVAVTDAVLKSGEETKYDVTFAVNTDTWFVLSNDPADQPGTLAA